MIGKFGPKAGVMYQTPVDLSTKAGVMYQTSVDLSTKVSTCNTKERLSSLFGEQQPFF